jgi:beta-glucanase (GH16 family)
MKRLLFAIWLMAFSVQVAQAGEWNLVWSDEFDYSGLPDKAKWGYEVGFVRNREAQFYTRDRKENARVENGTLILEARKEAWPASRSGGRVAEYTSASLTTQGKAEWQHVRIEVRAKLPTGKGMWPSIWTLGSDIDKTGWPACGEIDIMENVGFDPATIHANIHTPTYNHTKRTNKGNRIGVAKPYEEFHVYAIEWRPDRIDFFVDDKKYFSFPNEGKGADVWPFDKKHYLLLNIAVGGTWGGAQGIDQAVFPQRMLVDYVRVYELAKGQQEPERDDLEPAR